MVLFYIDINNIRSQDNSKCLNLCTNGFSLSINAPILHEEASI